MRITNNYMTRNYLGNLNSTLQLYNESGNRLTTGRKFNKMSENVSDGSRALTIRTQSYKNEQIQENVKKAGESLSVAESNLMSIEGIVSMVNDETIKALNATNRTSVSIFSVDFNALKNQIVEFANCRYNNTYVLGGTNNSTPPFTVNDDGDLCFNGVNVNEIKKENGKFFSEDEFSDTYEVPYSRNVYIDIGIGMAVKNGEVDPRTAFNMSVSGIECLGYGTTEITYTDDNGNEQTIDAPNNAYELIDEMAKCLDNEEFGKLGALNDQLRKSFEKITTEISDIGIRTNYLDRHTARLEDEEYVLTEIQNDIEYIKDTDELINNKSMEYSWMLTLQYGSKVLPKSLMDFVQ